MTSSKANAVTGEKIVDQVDTYQFKPELTCRWDPCPDTDPANFEGWGTPSGWLPADRITTLDALGGGLDLLGIEVTYHHTAVTGLIPGVERDLVERALIRLEPDVFEITTPTTVP